MTTPSTSSNKSQDNERTFPEAIPYFTLRISSCQMRSDEHPLFQALTCDVLNIIVVHPPQVSVGERRRRLRVEGRLIYVAVKLSETSDSDAMGLGYQSLSQAIQAENPYSSGIKASSASHYIPE